MLSGNLSKVGARDFHDDGEEFQRLRGKSQWRGRREGCRVSPSDGKNCSSLRVCALAMAFAWCDLSWNFEWQSELKCHLLREGYHPS